MLDTTETVIILCIFALIFIAWAWPASEDEVMEEDDEEDDFEDEEDEELDEEEDDEL